ncbi:MAG: glycosyltransferase family 39 protein [Solirubrobacteraceae bacterium]
MHTQQRSSRCSAPDARSASAEAVWIVLGLTALAAILRFATLDVQSIWLDESATIILVHRGFAGMLSHLSASESAPPLYYILVWAWTKVLGAGPLGFRSFSALAGTITVPVMYLAGRRISPRVGLWAAALTAVNPAMYYYSQEARCYALLILFSAGAFVLWQRALETPSRQRLVLWSGMSILALLTHYFAVFLFIPEAFILARRLGWRRLLVPIGTVSIVGIALLPLAISERSGGKKSEWIEESALISRMGETAKELVVGVYGPLEIFSAFLCALLAAGALWLLIRRGDAHERRSAREVAIVAATAILIPLLLAATHAVDVFDGRNVIATWVPWAVLLAAGLGVARAPKAGAFLGLGLCAVSLAVIAATNLIPGYQRDDWRGAAHALPKSGPSNRILISELDSSLPLSIYLPATKALTGPTVSTRELDFIALRTRRTGRSPLPPQAPTQAPPGFRFLGVRKTESYAVSTFLAPQATTVNLRLLRKLSEEPEAEAILQR